MGVSLARNSLTSFIPSHFPIQLYSGPTLALLPSVDEVGVARSWASEQTTETTPSLSL